jgi:Flp pilus assembly protein TadD
MVSDDARASRSAAGPARDDRIRAGGVAVALGLLTIVAFLPSLDNGFVATWDDGPNLLENPHLREFGWPSFSWACRAFLLGVYQPLAWLLFFAQYAVWGLEPWGYHLVSLLWHSVNAILFFLLTRELLERARPGLADQDRTFGAALAAALFAVHPLRVEIVAWASCQPYLPCACLCLLTLLVYLRAQTEDRHRLRLLVVCWVLFLAALLCKSSAVPLPLVLLIVDVYPLRRLGARDGRGICPAAPRVWLGKAPFFVLGGLFAAVAYRARSSLEVVTQVPNLSSRLARVGYSLAYYPTKTVIPTGLIPYHPIRSSANLGEPLFQLCAASALGLSVALFLGRKRWPGMLAAWMSYVVLLAPNSGIVRMGSMLVADRYSYLATMGGFVLAAAGIAELRTWARSRRLKLGIAIVGLVLLLFLLPPTWRQCRIWNSAEATWTYAAACFAEAVRAEPASGEAHHNLGVALFYCRRLDEAIGEFHTALKLDPALATSYGSLAQALVESGRNDEALIALSRAVRLDPDNPDVHGGIALLLIKQGRLGEARAAYLDALRLQPYSANWHAGLGVVLFRQGRIEDAALELSEAVRLDPDDLHIQDQLRQVRRIQAHRSASGRKGVSAGVADPPVRAQ